MTEMYEEKNTVTSGNTIEMFKRLVFSGKFIVKKFLFPRPDRLKIASKIKLDLSLQRK